jgi:glycine hydroxymethyltransferase
MYLLKNFLGEKYARVNKILDSYNAIQNGYINLEACCSYPFESVMEAQKYPLFTLPTEGVAGSRYFPTFDSIEDIDCYAEELTRHLFKIDESYRVSTQPHSGTQANQIVYNSILSTGDIVLSLSTKDGGHISHNKISNKSNVVINYHLTAKLEIDYCEIERLALVHHPKLIIVGTSSYPNKIDFKCIAEIAHRNGAYLMADICHSVLYIMAKTFPNVFPYADFVTFTMDKTLRGPQGGIVIYRDKFHENISYSIFPKCQGGPLQTIQFAKMVALVELSSINIQAYAQTVQKNARIICNSLIKHNIPVITGNTDTHIILIDVTVFGITGKIAEQKLFKYNILANRNLIPNDHMSPEITSGIRFGSACISILNYSEEDVFLLTDTLSDIIMERRVNCSTIDYLIDKYHKCINISN